MTDRRRIRPRLVHGRVQRRLGWRRPLAFQHVVVEIDHQNIASRQAGAARIARLNQRSVRPGDTRANMAAEVHDFLHHHDACAVGKLLTQTLNVRLGHTTSLFLAAPTPTQWLPSPLLTGWLPTLPLTRWLAAP